MQKDFHYYATYCAACLAGYSHEESLDICFSAQFVDLCSVSLLNKVKGPKSAATTQLQLELMDAGDDPLTLQEMTRIWSSFHFLPGNLYAEKKGCSKKYLNKYRLICNTNGALLKDTVENAKGSGTRGAGLSDEAMATGELPAASNLQAIGIAMHVLADTWAHRYFAGTPSLVINNTDFHFYEIVPDKDTYRRQKVTFRHSVSAEDDLENSIYTNSVYQSSETSIMNLGHGRAGHLPDYSFIRYNYLPAWGEYKEFQKDNPSDYVHAFCQMVYALRYLHGDIPTFETDTYDTVTTAPWADDIIGIIKKRQLDACDDWKELGERISGHEIPDFDMEAYQDEYIQASGDDKDNSFLGRFFLTAMSHKSMITDRIFRSGNLLAGISVDFADKGFKGVKDYRKLVDQKNREGRDE